MRKGWNLSYGCGSWAAGNCAAESCAAGTVLLRQAQQQVLLSYNEDLNFWLTATASYKLTLSHQLTATNLVYTAYSTGAVSFVFTCPYRLELAFL